MKRFVILASVALAGCVSEPATQGQVGPGWTRVTGPVAYDDGNLLRGTLTIDAQDDLRVATLGDMMSTQFMLASPRPAAEAFAKAMVERTGCRPAEGVRIQPGELRLVLVCR